MNNNECEGAGNRVCDYNRNIPSCAKRDTDYSGYDIDYRANVGSSGDCQNICRDHPDCYWFTFKESTDECLLKNLDWGETSSNGAISGPQECDDNAFGHCLPHEQCYEGGCCAQGSSCNTCPYGYETNNDECAGKGNRICKYDSGFPGCSEIDTDYYGNDISSVSGLYSANRCQEACLEHSECSWFTYHLESQECFLKTSESGRGDRSNVISGPAACDADPPSYRRCLPHQKCDAGDCCSQGSSCNTCPHGWLQNDHECGGKGNRICRHFYAEEESALAEETKKIISHILDDANAERHLIIDALAVIGVFAILSIVYWCFFATIVAKVEHEYTPVEEEI